MELHPALQGQLGSWRYYSTKMTARALAANVKFASEVWHAKALDLAIQRMLKESRAKESIASYLANHEDRFFNSIVVAAIEGNPTFFGVNLADDPRFEMIADRRFMDAFGVLRFDGSQRYYALDGQHRLRAIRALLDRETEHAPPPGFEDEEFSVLIVVPKPGEEPQGFLKKYRRLFSHLNRYAKPMDRSTTIIMEEDDAIAIATRRLIAEHEFFSYVSADDEPRIRPRGPENVRVDEPAFTSLEALYNANTNLLFAAHRKNSDEWGGRGLTPAKKLESFIRFRPEDAMLDGLSTELELYWNCILAEVPQLYRDPHMMRSDLGEDEDADDGFGVRTNWLLFRPIGLSLLSRLVRELLDNAPDPRNPTRDSVAAAIKGLGVLEWRLFMPPWKHLLYLYDDNENKWRMRSEQRKEAEDCGLQLLRYITGRDQHSPESLKTMRDDWRSRLIGAPDEKVNELWDRILEQATTFMKAHE